MVMKKNRMRTNLSRSIMRSLGRYIAIVAIIALGCSLFMGLKITKRDMVATGQDYTDEQNMFDLHLLNTYGWTQAQVDKVKDLDGVVDAEGSIYLDAFVKGDSGTDSVYRLYSMPEKVNMVYLLSGEMPSSPDECLVDGEMFGDSIIGEEITVTAGNDPDTLDSLRYHTYTVVGRISSPIYMDMTRGSTTLGSGSIACYVYLPAEAFDVDYFTGIYATLEGDWTVYSEEYNDFMDDMAEALTPSVELLAQLRFDNLIADAEREYADGLREYEDGLIEYENGRLEALQALADALAELEKAQADINDGWIQVNDGEVQRNDAQKQLDDARKQLDAAMLELENGKVEAFTQIADAYQDLADNEKMVKDSLNQVTDGLAQIDDGLSQIESGLSQIENSLPLLELMIGLQQTQVEYTQQSLEAAKRLGNDRLIESLEATLAEQTATLEEYQSQYDEAVVTQEQLLVTQAELDAQRVELAATEKVLRESLTAIEDGHSQLQTQKAVLENQFAAAAAKINAGYLELDAGQRELDAKKTEWAAGRQELIDGQAELDAARLEYEQGKADAETELAEAKAKLDDAAIQLADARKTIDEMTGPDIFVLTRNTNAGYLALDSNSDIVDGIAEILPVFFLLIASLVCITTMTRMVEEERTQIGTLKALGHSKGSIMGKYLWYSVSAAILGCSLGCIVGCSFFPNLLWNAYGILFNIRPNVVLTVDWQLCLGITAAYIACSTFATWYCCYRTLREVPAELIRPKAPDTGRKSLMEKLPFWKHMSFLNKVMLRNVFRYKQRLLMMLIGIGGCTALLLTGFGMRDTIIDIANIQFSEVNHFDIEVYFSEGRTEEQKDQFLADLKAEGITNKVGFFYQTSVEMGFDGQARDVYLISAENEIKNYLSFNRNGEEFDMPDLGEALISVGIAEIMGINLGDTITIRDADMRTMTLKVSGIYENHVQNFCIVSPQTVEDQWGAVPADQMAFLLVKNGVDVHEANAFITNMDGVINTTVCEDSADMVNNMMAALDMIVVVIVFSAGLLGAIVLYNLTNINSTERIREIATIKVLGFRAGETSAYVFKENILLTVLGMILGLPLGRWFLGFIVERLKIDMVWFKTRLSLPSYLYAMILTLLCATVVDFIFHHKLQKINMAEALKSVE